jgi:hypothetical protein
VNNVICRNRNLVELKVTGSTTLEGRFHVRVIAYTHKEHNFFIVLSLHFYAVHDRTMNYYYDLCFCYSSVVDVKDTLTYGTESHGMHGVYNKLIMYSHT